jgi:hypothetical protein
MDKWGARQNEVAGKWAQEPWGVTTDCAGDPGKMEDKEESKRAEAERGDRTDEAKDWCKWEKVADQECPIEQGGGKHRKWQKWQKQIWLDKRIASTEEDELERPAHLLDLRSLRGKRRSWQHQTPLWRQDEPASELRSADNPGLWRSMTGIDGCHWQDLSTIGSLFSNCTTELLIFCYVSEPDIVPSSLDLIYLPCTSQSSALQTATSGWDTCIFLQTTDECIYRFTGTVNHNSE